MDLDQLRAIRVTTIDGQPGKSLADVERPTVYLLVDAEGMERDRIDAEIAWVIERLQRDIDLVLIWPDGKETEARACNFCGGTRVMIDAFGGFRDLVSPEGRRAAILVDPVRVLVEMVTESHPAFDVASQAHGRRRRRDRTIDLGDVQH
jgi:hypothetical protein